MHRTTDELTARVEEFLASPTDNGAVELIVRRPDDGQREVVERATISRAAGMAGDNWVSRVNSDGVPNYEAQLTLMNSRVIEAMAGERDRWPLCR